MTAACRIEIAACTHRGRVRERNEDAAGADGWLLVDGLLASHEAPIDRPRCCVLADGAGGHPAGERASALAVAALLRRSAEVTALADLEQAIVAVHGELHEVMEREPPLRGMGTTIAALVATPDTVMVANVGDSRAYSLEEGRLLALTVDDRPEVPGWAPQGTQTSLLTQLLGGYERAAVPTPHGERVRLEPGLRFLLCSDGVGACLDEADVEAVLGAAASAQAGVRGLVDAALEAGAPDNVTAIIAAITARP